MSLRTGLVLVILAVFTPRAWSDTSTYSIAMPQVDAAVFEIPFRVEYPGRVVVEVTWQDPRIVALRLEGPGPSVSRRSGPSPQRLEVDVPEGEAGNGRWRLWVRVPPTRDAGQASLTLTLPDAPEVVAIQQAASEPPPPPPPVPDPWTLPRSAPGGSSPFVEALYSAVERLRATVYGPAETTPHDGCGWQRPLVRWLAETRDTYATTRVGPSAVTREYLTRLAAAVDAVEAMRTSDNPLLAGPVPEDSLRRRAWEAARRDELRELENSLDALAERLRDGRVPELTEPDWPARFVACLTAAERHFEDRVPSGEDAVNRELADSQWPAFLAAAPALLAVGHLPPP